MSNHTAMACQQILQVVEQRLSRAAKALLDTQKAMVVVRQDILEKANSIANIQNNKQVLQAYCSGPLSQNNGTVSPDINTACCAEEYARALQNLHWQNYDLEREQYYLEISQAEEQELTAKSRTLEQQIRSLSVKKDQLLMQVRQLKKCKERKRTQCLQADYAYSVKTGIGGLP